MGRGGVIPQTIPNLLCSDVSPNQIPTLEQTEAVGRQNSSLRIQMYKLSHFMKERMTHDFEPKIRVR